MTKSARLFYSFNQKDTDKMNPEEKIHVIVAPDVEMLTPRPLTLDEISAIAGAPEVGNAPSSGPV